MKLIDQDELDTSTFRTPGESTSGQRTIAVSLDGTLARLQQWGV